VTKRIFARRPRPIAAELYRMAAFDAADFKLRTSRLFFFLRLFLLCTCFSFSVCLFSLHALLASAVAFLSSTFFTS